MELGKQTCQHRWCRYDWGLLPAWILSLAGSIFRFGKERFASPRKALTVLHNAENMIAPERETPPQSERTFILTANKKYAIKA